MLKAGGAYFDSRTHHSTSAKDRLHPMLVLWIYCHFFRLRSVPHVYNSDYHTPNFGCYILCLIDWRALSPTLYANRKGGLFLLYLPDRILSLQCLLTLITAKFYTKQRPSKVLSTTKIFIGGRGDGSGGGNSKRGLGKGKSCL